MGTFGELGGRRWNGSEKMKGELNPLEIGVDCTEVKQSDLTLGGSHKKRRVGFRRRDYCKSKALEAHGLFSSG